MPDRSGCLSGVRLTVACAPKMIGAKPSTSAGTVMRVSTSARVLVAAVSRRRRSSLAFVLRRPSLGFRATAFDEVLGAIERRVLRAELRERVGLDGIDVLM